MTFVYTEKRNDLIYILADTFWERPSRGVYDQWKLDPMVKIVPLPQGKVAAFAGNSYAAEEAFKTLFENFPTNAADVLLACNRASIMSGQSVDFILADQNDLSLFEIANGEMHKRQNVYLGSNSAFSLFQCTRGVDHGSERPEHVKFRIQKMPDGVQKDSAERYGAALDAFEKAIRELNDGSCGGFPIPIFMTKWEISFGAYLHTIRAPLSMSESKPGEWGALSFQDSILGGYQVIFAGNEKAFSLNYPYGNIGFIHTGYKNDGLFARKLTVNDPYDFTHAAESAGCPPSISSWRNYANDGWKIRQLIDSEEWFLAERLMQNCGVQVIKHLASMNPDVPFDDTKNLYHNLRLVDEFHSDSENLDHITFLLDAERVLRGNMAGQAAENYNWWKSNLDVSN